MLHRIPGFVGKIGTAARRNVGTAANNVVALDGSAKLPAVDGSQLTGLAASQAPRGYVSGLTLSFNAGNGNLGIDPGVCTSDDGTTTMTLPAASQKNATLAFGVGLAGQGSLDTGSITASTWYHVFLIENTSTLAVDVLTSLSATAPLMPTGFNKKRRIGCFKSTASSLITPFFQLWDKFLLATPVQDFIVVNPGLAAVTRTLASVPTGVKVEALLAAMLLQSNTAAVAYFSSLDVADTVASANAGFSIGIDAGNSADGLSAAGSQVSVFTNTSAQIRTRLSVSDANTSFRTSTLGWIDTRGRFA